MKWMKRKSGVLGIVIAIVALVVIAAMMIVPTYNKLVNLDEDVNQQYSQIETQLQRRVDLIPNLVNTVKGYAAHEKEVLENIADARSKMAGAQGPEEQAAADG